MFLYSTWVYAYAYCFKQASVVQAKVPPATTTTAAALEDFDLPSPPASLPLNQHREYIQLKRKLALHEKKKRRDMKTSAQNMATKKDSSPTPSGASSKLGAMATSRSIASSKEEAIATNSKMEAVPTSKSSGSSDIESSAASKSSDSGKVEIVTVSKNLGRSKAEAVITSSKSSGISVIESNKASSSSMETTASDIKKSSGTDSVATRKVASRGTLSTSKSMPIVISKPISSIPSEAISPATTKETASTVAAKAKTAKKKEEQALVALRIVECSARLVGHKEKLKSSRALEIREQKRITDLTNQLTDCVSEIAEHEQSMEKVQQELLTLQKQLEVSITCIFFFTVVVIGYMLVYSSYSSLFLSL